MCSVRGCSLFSLVGRVALSMVCGFVRGCLTMHLVRFDGTIKSGSD